MLIPKKNISIEKKALKGASWLAIFKLGSQTLSWVVTILVARILVPEDYGLAAMATIIVGFGQMLSEFGLGAAIIQKKDASDEDLNSVFWFALSVGLCFAILCYFGAYPLAIYFKDQRIIPLTQVASTVFIVSSINIVPHNLLKKKMRFKKIGQIELMTVFLSNILILGIAVMGAGVWAIILGPIAVGATRTIALYSVVRWIPNLRVNFKKAKSFIAFGANVSIGRIFFYVFESSDKFFAGRVWSPHVLGYYSLAVQLARIPTEKIVVLINQVSYAALSELQDEEERFNAFYLKIVRITAIIVMPLFAGGYLAGDNVIRILFNEKWYQIIDIFRLLCLTQIVTSINAINSFVHYSKGKPKRSLYFHVLLGISMGLSFFVAVDYGLNAILIPWFTVYLVVCFGWIVYTIKKIGITVLAYLKNIYLPVFATIAMCLLVTFVVGMVELEGPYREVLTLAVKSGLGAATYLCIILLLDWNLIKEIQAVIKNR